MCFEFSIRLRSGFTDLESDKAADDDLVADLLAYFCDVIPHADLGVAFHETLIHEAVGLEELLQHARENFFSRSAAFLANASC